MSAKMGPNYEAYSSDGGKSIIIVNSAAHPTHCPTPAPGIVRSNKHFKYTETNDLARIKLSGLLGIDPHRERLRQRQHVFRKLRTLHYRSGN